MFRLSAKLHHNWGYLLLFMRREAHKPTGPVVSTWHNKENSPKLTSTFFLRAIYSWETETMGDGWSAEAGGAAEAVGAVDGGRGTQPVSSTWAANSYQATISFRAQNLFYGKKSIYYSYKKISLCVYIACWTIKVTTEELASPHWFSRTCKSALDQ